MKGKKHLHVRIQTALWIALAFGASVSGDAGAVAYRFRFAFVTNMLNHNEDVDDLRAMMVRVANAGYNGIVLRTNFDRIARENDAFLRRLELVRELQDDVGVLVVPQVFSAGYGAPLLEHDRNLAGAVPVRGQRFVVAGDAARLAPDDRVQIVNGGFEADGRHRAQGVHFQDRPGETTSIDDSIAHSGGASMRFEAFDGAKRRYARVMYKLDVRPFRPYRVSLWIKTQELTPGSFLAQVLGEHDRVLVMHVPTVEATSGDWQRVVFGFNSLQHDTVRLYAGVWTGRRGRFWIDDITIEEAGLINVLRRPGTPVTVRATNDETYREGKDYEAIADPQLNFTFDHGGSPIRLLPGSAIQDGDTLMVDYYQGLMVRRGQIGVCLSEPRVFELYEEVVDLLERHLRPTHYFISGDEIRHGGWCRTCKERGVTMGEIIGTAFNRQFEIIRSRNPDAVVFMWSDMIDPAANARDHFFLINGDIAGSWQYVPTDIVSVVWEPRFREASLQHFDGLGMRTMVSTYADHGGLAELHLWLGELAKCRQAVGVMYTTWRDDFSQLEAFGEAINKE